MTAQLSPQEHRYLWYIAQGYTPSEAGPLMGVKRTPCISQRIREKFGARTTAQAVHLATLADLLGPYIECGSLRGYRAHGARHEDTCRACRRAFAEHIERSGSPIIPRPVPLTEPELRLLRAFDAGRTFKQVATNWDVTARTLRDVRASLYRKLGVAHLQQQARYYAALDEGRRLGYLKAEYTAPAPQLNPRRWGTTDLTDLEVRTLSVLATGVSLHEAGQILGGTPGPQVSSRLARIYKKLDVLAYGHGERREAAVKEARNRGYAL